MTTTLAQRFAATAAERAMPIWLDSRHISRILKLKNNCTHSCEFVVLAKLPFEGNQN